MIRSSDTTANAEALLKGFAADVDEQHLSRMIDAPILRTLRAFLPLTARAQDYGVFMRLAGRFIRHTYRHALPASRTISSTQARAKALSLIMYGYANANWRGSDALLDDLAQFGARGAERALEQLAGVIISQRRDIHVRWSTHYYINSADWSTKKAMASLVLARYSSHLPAALVRGGAEQVAGVLAGVVQKLVDGGCRFANS